MIICGIGCLERRSRTINCTNHQNGTNCSTVRDIIKIETEPKSREILPALNIEEEKTMKINEVQATTAGVVGAVSVAGAWLFDRIGILLYVLLLLIVMMFADYLTGMMASKREALDHPNDPAYGWNSAKGAIGIFKKVAYMFVILVAVAVDYIIRKVAAEVGLQIDVKAIFGLMVAVWYLLNEMLSIIENAGRMGASVPDWLTKYISVLKNKIDDKGD